MSDEASGKIDTVMLETRLFPPPADFAKRARIPSLAAYERLWSEAADDLEGFWGRAADELHWFRPWQRVLDWKEPFAQWFAGGQTNASFNCLDRHLGTPVQDKLALVWEGEPGDTRHVYVCPTTPRGLPIRWGAQIAGSRDRRCRLDLHADGPRVGHRHVGLRGLGPCIR